jgi:hypothetical protein
MDFASFYEKVVWMIIPALGAVLWWIITNTKSKLDTMEKEIAQHKLHVAENYVNHSDLADAMNGIKEVLGGMSRQIFSLTADFKDFSVRVYDKLDRKADKDTLKS